MTRTVYDFTLPALNGGEIKLSHWKNRPILLVNTASKCRYTAQYDDLQILWEDVSKKTPKGLVIIGIPSSDFGKQELASSEEIFGFCEKNYGVTFPLAAKSNVKGTKAIPLFQWLAQEGGYFSLPRWNFYKYLFNREGQLVKWFTPLTSPKSTRFLKAIQRVTD
ncbi:glutathione peroxidase [Aristophania vespae]|uniref:Glutathione peroxidase n=1 Tax=Aristophania vespae TaxID=2697033 RepID=A0A6P1NKJ0_9PROT|nr:glutathione peroxidase [Aristophania vespae]QHI95381.1 glutathione peroxidase [Aristophania vespae]